MKRKTTFWSTANGSFSANERKAFNKWRNDLYRSAIKLGDYVHIISDLDPGLDAEQRLRYLEELMSKVNEVPLMYGKESC